MVLEFIFVFVIVIFYLYHYANNWEENRRKFNLLPGGVEWPLIGSSIQVATTVGFTGEHWERFHRCAKVYGQTYGIKVGSVRACYTENNDTLREVLNSPDWVDRFPDHPRFREHLLDQNIGLMWCGYEENKEIRKFTVRTLRNFGFGGMNTTEVFMQEELEDLFRYIDECRSKGKIQNEVLFHQVYKTPALNMLWRIMAGTRFSYEDPNLRKLINAVEDIAKINVGLDLEWHFPIIRYIPGCSPSRAKRPSFEIIHKFFMNIRDERKKTGSYKEIQNDFIDFFLKKIDEEKGNPNTLYTDDQFQCVCVDLLFGGLDTVANSLELAFLYLTKFPEVQVKIQDEIDRVVGLDRLPNVMDRTKLKYCEATMWETLRFAQFIPLYVRTSACNTTIEGYNVQKGTACILSAAAANLDKEVWGEDPENFRPDRFMDTDGNLINIEKVTAFGGGKRQCPGYLMAKVTWITFISGILQRYSFTPSPKNPILSTIPSYGIANSAKPFYSIVTPRQTNIAQ